MGLQLAISGIVKENLQQKFIIDIYNEKQWSILNKLPVTTDQYDKVISNFGDDEWDLSAYISNVATHSRRYFSFHQISNENLKQELKIICYAWLYFSSGRRSNYFVKASTLIERQRHLRTVYEFLESQDLSSVGSLNHPANFFAICEHIKSRQLSKGTIITFFGCLISIERLKGVLPIRLELPATKSFKKLAADLADPKKTASNQYYAIPTNIMEKIYGKAIEVIELCHPLKEDFYALMVESRNNYVQGKAIVDSKIDSGLWTWLSRSSDQYRVEVNKHMPRKIKQIFNTFINNQDSLKKSGIFSDVSLQRSFSHIQVACYIACGAFSGMRKSELYQLRSDSFVSRELNGEKFYSLKSSSVKFSVGKPVSEEWLATPICEKAVELAEAITRDMRAQLQNSRHQKDRDNADILWISQNTKTRKPAVRKSSTLKGILKQFSKLANATITHADIKEFELLNPNSNMMLAKDIIKEGEIWPLSSHQFRRTYAVFGKRYSLCTDIAIKQQFKHILLPMSQWYGEGGKASHLHDISVDKELFKLISETQQDYIANKLFNWFSSPETLAGNKGKEIMQNRAHLSKKYSSWKDVSQLISQGRLQISGTLHSYCMAGYECKMEKISNPANCMNCDNLVIDEEQAHTWKERHSWAVSMVDELNKTNVLSHSRYSHFITQIKAAESILKTFKIEYKPFNFDIEVLNHE